MDGGSPKQHEYSSLSFPRLRNLSGSFCKRKFMYCFVPDKLMGTSAGTGCQQTFRKHSDSDCVSSFCGQVKVKPSFVFRL